MEYEIPDADLTLHGLMVWTHGFLLTYIWAVVPVALGYMAYRYLWHFFFNRSLDR